ncbi:MAG: hypothetical protein LBK50_02865 [Candidatus Nomurabacteria bacterium]|jgi:hypothetical protein|nr:hypothetical protein [Candidatus Nomurabacteria bacterium]
MYVKTINDPAKVEKDIKKYARNCIATEGANHTLLQLLVIVGVFSVLCGFIGEYRALSAYIILVGIMAFGFATYVLSVFLQKLIIQKRYGIVIDVIVKTTADATVAQKSAADSANDDKDADDVTITYASK